MNADSFYSPVVYGPIASRRLGQSLGINLLPINRKICSFDCIYCECGKSADSSRRGTGFLRPEALHQEAEKCFNWHANAKTSIAYISFAGNGEPTLYPWFEQAVDSIIELRNKYLPNIPISIFTNATRAHDPQVISSLYKFDRRFLKLDAGDAETYRLIDKPLVDFSFDDIISSLAELRNIEVSTAVIDGCVTNITSLMSEGYVEAIEKIRPIGVFIYAIDRPGSYSGLKTATAFTLGEISYYLRERLGVPITVLKSKKYRPSWFDESYAGLAPMVAPVVYPV